MTPNKKPKYEREYQIYLAHHAMKLSGRADVIKAPLADSTLERFAVAVAYYDATFSTDESPAIGLSSYTEFVSMLAKAGMIPAADSAQSFIEE